MASSSHSSPNDAISSPSSIFAGGGSSSNVGEDSTADDTTTTTCGIGMLPQQIFSSMVQPLFQRQQQQSPTSSDINGNDAGGASSSLSASTNNYNKTMMSMMKRRTRTNHNRQVDETDALLAMEFNQLSIDARERVLEEVHGITQIADETQPNFIDDSLCKLDSEIKNIKERWHYDRAHFLCPSRVRDVNFRLMFLRADNFNPRNAARRIVQHFTYKAELFGEEKLIHPITLDDLDEDDKRTLMSGSMQVLPNKDNGGRTVLFLNRRYDNFKSWKNQFRVVWYLTMAALEDESCQRYGLTAIDYHSYVDERSSSKKDNNFSDTGRQFLNESYRRTHLLRDGLPVRVVSLHFCYDDERMQAVMSVLRLFIGKDLRFRFRDHFGSHMECVYKLMSFGITPDMLPFDKTGKFSLIQFMEYLEQRRIKEDEARRKDESMGMILYPNPEDVLMGRGRPFQQFVGNLNLAKIVAEHQSEYNESERNSKTKLTRKLVQVIKDGNGRFLKRDGKPDGGWVEVNDAQSREKVAHAFRYNSSSRGGGSEMDDCDFDTFSAGSRTKRQKA